MDKEIITFGGIEFKERRFHHHKNLFFRRYRN